jgi:hypothetical protein
MPSRETSPFKSTKIVQNQTNVICLTTTKMLDSSYIDTGRHHSCPVKRYFMLVRDSIPNWRCIFLFMEFSVIASTAENGNQTC